ncbi:MAG TPA: choice-of-anchor L domain-containing protein [Flavobacteriales bacterium]|nr:choice-of-anchor L domain-containing protein [Flavobacteriales bacterium]
MKKTLLALAVFAYSQANAQLTVTDSLTTAQVETLLTGLGVTITGVTVNCHSQSLAQFSGITEVPITNGILLSTGKAEDFANSASFLAQADMGTPGDSTIYYELGGVIATYDGCSVDFDCVPSEDTLEFNFAFGSEEYLEWVGAGVNDAFGIYITGPGFTGSPNVATLPGGEIVCVDSVNAWTNPTYYVDNSAGAYVSFDGFTTNLKAFAVVIPGSSYHFKVAISDVADGIFDTGVMLEAFSFRSVSAGVTTGIANATPKSKVTAYPNPTSGIINFSGENISEVILADATGKTIMSKQMNGTNSMDISTLETGSYFAKIVSANGVEVKLISKI